MKYYDLTREEQQLDQDMEHGVFVPVPDQEKKKKQYQEYAKNTLNKTRNINIRIAGRDLAKLKARAAREGIPYQTLASSLIHKYTSVSEASE